MVSQRTSNALFWAAFLVFGVFITIKGGHNTLDRLAETEHLAKQAYIEAVYRYRRYLVLTPTTTQTQPIKSAIRHYQTQFATHATDTQWLDAMHAEYQALHAELLDSGIKESLAHIIDMAAFKKTNYEQNKALYLATQRRIPYRWIRRS